MKYVFAFDCSGSDLSDFYGDDILELMLKSGMLQQSKTSVRVSVGDLLTSMRIQAAKESATWADVERINQLILTGGGEDRIDRDAVSRITGKSEIACWLIENLQPEIAAAVHEFLKSESAAYLGTAEVRFDSPLQWMFLLNGLVQKYRLKGTEAALFYSMGNQEDADFIDEETFQNHGFVVSREDTGLRWTMFDPFLSDQKFAARVAVFEDLASQLPTIDRLDASNLAFFIEELHPRLFDVLHALVKAISNAETVEEISQAALSGRRFLQQFADYVFPPIKSAPGERNLGGEMHKNRLWAYLGRAFGEGSEQQTGLGHRFDVIYDFFNSSVHATRTEDEVKAKAAELIRLVSDTIRLNPEAARDPYKAYYDDFLDSFKQLFVDRAENPLLGH